jgi:hypothetical protein
MKTTTALGMSSLIVLDETRPMKATGMFTATREYRRERSAR